MSELYETPYGRKTGRLLTDAMDIYTKHQNDPVYNMAHELLETLEGLHKALSRMIDKHDPDSIEAEWLQHSHEAICKAKGEKP